MAFPERAQKVCQPLRLVHHAEAASPAQQIGCRLRDLLQRAADLCAGTLPGAFRRQSTAAGGVVGGIAHYQIKTAGAQQGTDLPQIPVEGKEAVGEAVFHCGPLRQADSGFLQLHAGDPELGLPLQQKKAQKSGACPQVAHPQPRPQPGQRGEEKRIRPRRKERIAVNKAVSSRAKGLPMLHQMHLLCVFPYYKENRPGLQAPRGHLWRSDLAGGGKRSIQDLARGKAQLV